jgi:5'-nucleotidase (lipoprotein e(P4) family)
MAVLYQQRAAEYRALCLQCYNLARLRVDEAIGNPKNYTNKPFAIVTDLDETALDNSGNEAWLLAHDSAFAQAEFDDWTIYGKAGAVPGSVDFFNYVSGLKDKKGRRVKIFYVSNRTSTPVVIDSTMSQMKTLGFPQLVDSQFLFRGKDSASSKEGRRRGVAGNHTILLLLGDNLVDHNAVFDHTAATPDVRMSRVDSMHADWGRKYILFPNAQYGDWEGALYPGGKYSNLATEKALRLKALKPAHW